MNGTGFYLWQIRQCPIDVLIPALHRAKARWVCIKVADGTVKWNQFDASGQYTGNDKYLKEYIARLRMENFEVGGWHFTYPIPTLSPGAQAGVIGERTQKFNLSHVLIDAEHVGRVGAYWKWYPEYPRLNPDRKRSASTYMNGIRPAGVTLRIPCGLSSYRFPSIHGEFPFKQHVNHVSSNLIAQQLYWQGSHNPAEQLAKSIEQYNEVVRVNHDPLPFVPIGSAYAVGDWEPTTDDLEEFIDAAQNSGCPAWGFWSIDWILTHNRTDWLDAIGGNGTPPPIPPPTIPDEMVIVNCTWLNGRSEPNSGVDNRVVSARAGQHVTPLGEPQNGWQKVRLDTVECWMYDKYLEAV